MILQGKGKDGAWAAATWGESDAGKSWMRLSAYGLPAATGSKAYHAWIAPKSGDPVQIGTLDPDNDGAAFIIAGNLPGVDQGKSVLISLDSENAKAPEEVLVQTSLPTLKPEVVSGAPQQQQQAAPAQQEIGK